MKYLFLMILAGAFSHSSIAIIVNESADFGDFSNTAAVNTSIGTLDVGVNVVNGSIAGACIGMYDCEHGDHLDSIFFLVPDGFELNSITVTSNLLFAPAGLALGILLEDETQTITTLDFNDIFEDETKIITSLDFNDIPLDGTTILDIPTLAASGYQFLIGPDAYDENEPGNYQTDYQIHFTVSPVPAPAGIWLFASAILTFAGLRAKKYRGQ